MLNKVAAFIAGNRLLDREAKHLVAVSGGADSVALMLVLRRLGYDVEAAHCNFRLRDAESDRDEQFVVKLCQEQSVRLHLIHFDTKTYAEVHQVSIEMAARQLRYGYFEQLRQDIGAGMVCVAHHQDDAVETLLMNLVRGTGIHGLTGIRPRNGHVVRPLLCVSRAEIVSFLNSIGQSYVTDSTNLVPDVVRNKLRLEVLPLLRTINPAVSANIVKTARRMAEVERVFNQSVESALSTLFTDNTVDIQQLLEQPSPEYLLYELLTPRGFTPTQVEQLYDSLGGQTGRVFRSETHEVAIDRGRIVVEKRHTQPAPLRIPETGTYCYGDVKFRFGIKEGREASKSPDCATLDADVLKFPVTIRPVQTGDRFCPFGMKGSRLVSDYLTDRKSTIFEKRRQLAICSADGLIAWLVGERTDQRFAVGDATRKVLSITIVKNDKTE